MTAAAAGIRAPKQARSADTLDRIVSAARALLDETSFEELSITRLMRRAGMSVGSFYTRFPHKEALLPYLYQRYDEGLEQTTGSVLEPRAWQRLRLAARVGRLVDLSVDAYRTHRGLWRAILLHAGSHPSIVTEEHRRKRRAMVRRIVALLLERRQEITHPEPERAAEFCITLLFATCKDQILLEERSHGTTRLSDRRLRRELTRTLCAYLGVRGGNRLG